jgi:hypothetical protein
VLLREKGHPRLHKGHKCCVSGWPLCHEGHECCEKGPQGNEYQNTDKTRTAIQDKLCFDWNKAAI